VRACACWRPPPSRRRWRSDRSSRGTDGGDGRDDTDTVVGGPGRDQLFGGDGSGDADYLFGGGGLDFMDGGLGGSDQLFGGPGNDRMSDGAVSYELSASPVEVDLGPERLGPTATGEGADYLGNVSDVVGSPFHDVLLGSGAGNVLRGGGDDDSISGGAGFDTLDGGDGDDTLDGGADRDVVSYEDSSAGVVASFVTGRAEGAGADSLTGFEMLVGSYYDDHLTGDDARNAIYGSYGSNEIFGLGGDDYLEFGDSGDAGDGVDECIWSSLDNCEWDGHFDPPSLPYLAEPPQRREVERLAAVEGGIAGGLGGPRDPAIIVSIRRMTLQGCSWWKSRSERFVRGGCGVTIGNRLIGESSGWSLPVGATLEPGAYRVSVTWQDERFRSPPCGGAFAPMCVWFDVR
jgi:hypothetical protein